jgi:hypothetical protein
VAVVTVRVVKLETEPNEAEIVVVPTPELVAKPLEPVLLLITATVAVEEVHVTDDVRSCVLPLVYEPVAVNC